MYHLERIKSFAVLAEEFEEEKYNINEAFIQ